MNNLQQQASNPEYSVWVAASAGTGKTKILTDRVLRLLIKGVEFKKILCLTFTNAASLEMQGRINSKLKELAYSDSDKLVYDLKSMMGREPSIEEIDKAKTLYHLQLENHEKINIYTIHSFCQKLLKSFPLEANINPEFQILDKISSQAVLLKIKRSLYSDIAYDSLINFFLSNFHENTIKEIFEEIIENKVKFQELFTYNTQEVIADINLTSTKLSFVYNEAELLIKKSKLDFLLEDKTIEELFFTKDGKKRNTFFSKEIKTRHPQLNTELSKLQAEAYEIDRQRKLEEMYNYSALLQKLAKVFLDKYEDYKTENNFLDYDDLIHKSKLLLWDKKNREWILDKLEGWFDHLLVDEAQDTSPQQWEIINAIIEEFSDKRDGSIFVVGDEKQSIFSFQGANLTNFHLVNNDLAPRLLKLNKKFRNITLELSYRSTSEILDTVHNLLEQIKNNTPQLFTSSNPRISSFRKNHQGKVEVLPLIRKDDEEQSSANISWLLPYNYTEFLSHPQLLAKKIASFIKEKLESKVILPSTGKPVTEGDIMILVRKRDAFVKDLANQLNNFNLQVEGLDRVLLKQNLAIMDLTTIAKFVLLPEDDLNLANLLKSPIINISEEQLYNIAIKRGNNSLFSVLPEEIYTKLNCFLQMYKNSNTCQFFTLIVNSLNLREVLEIVDRGSNKEAIDEFLLLSYNYLNQGDNSLQGFVAWFENNEIEIKRDIEASNKIRIMTTHGAKGLQAPIVILCDTTSVPINKNKFMWTEDFRMFSCLQIADIPEFFKDLKKQQQQNDLQEYVRLLYVAMTRAEDHLVICGSYGKNKLPENCWYELIHKVQQAEQIRDSASTIQSQTEIINPEVCDQSIEEVAPFLPEILPNIISKYAKRNIPVNSPFTSVNYLEYGRVFHKILEDGIKAQDLRLIRTHPLIQELPLNLQEKIKKNLDKLFNNQGFLNLINYKLLSEVSIGINLEDEVKTGRIDLLAILDKEIIIIDYKSDSKPPVNSAMVQEKYIDQLNFYRHVIQELYPKNKIITKILWLENSELMNL